MSTNGKKFKKVFNLVLHRHNISMVNLVIAVLHVILMLVFSDIFPPKLICPHAAPTHTLKPQMNANPYYYMLDLV